MLLSHFCRICFKTLYYSNLNRSISEPHQSLLHQLCLDDGNESFLKRRLHCVLKVCGNIFWHKITGGCYILAVMMCVLTANGLRYKFPLLLHLWGGRHLLGKTATSNSPEMEHNSNFVSYPTLDHPLSLATKLRSQFIRGT